MTHDYFGTKHIRAFEQMKDGEAGYGVIYPDGYQSWSPAAAFEDAYQRIDLGMSFGHALVAVQAGHRIQRLGWSSFSIMVSPLGWASISMNGKGAFVAYMPPLYLPPFNTQDTTRKVNDRTAKWIGADQPLDCQPYLAMYTADGKWVPGWLASQTDMLANDWVVLDADGNPAKELPF